MWRFLTLASGSSASRSGRGWSAAGSPTLTSACCWNNPPGVRPSQPSTCTLLRWEGSFKCLLFQLFIYNFYLRFDLVLFSGDLYARPGLSDQRDRPHRHQRCAAPAHSLQGRSVPARTPGWHLSELPSDLRPQTRSSCCGPAPSLLRSGQQEPEPSSQCPWKRSAPHTKSAIGFRADISLVSVGLPPRFHGTHTSWTDVWCGNLSNLVGCFLLLSRLSCDPPASSLRT